MMNRMNSPFVLVAIGTILLVLAGCVGSSAPTRFYVLNSTLAKSAETEASAGARCIAIGVGPVDMPDYLDRPEIVNRLSPNELHVAQFHQWAEPLGSNVNRVLAENLSRILCADAVVVFPWSGSTPVDYKVTVEVLHFDGKIGGNADLIAQWFIFAGDEGKTLATRKSSFSEPSGDGDYEALVSAQSRIVEKLSVEIAEAIRNILKRGPAE
jgi:uncharacterized lipoprotein YmbA